MRKKVEIIADYEVFLKDKGTIGHAYKITPPNIVHAKETVTSGVGDYEIAIGQLEKIELSCTMANEDVSYYIESGHINDAELDLIEVAKDGSNTRGGLFEAVGTLDIEVGDSERKGKKEVTLKMSCVSIFHSIDGKRAYDIDHRINKCIVGDTDMNEETNKILGR